MNRTYYKVRYRLDNDIRYLIWYSNDADGVVIGRDGLVPSFRTEHSLVAYAQDEGLSPLDETESEIHNLDIVTKWLKSKTPGQLDPVALLTAWNLFADMSMSIGGGFDSDKERTLEVYEKLFWGNNLPSLTPPGGHYSPLWSDQEIDTMRQVLSEGLSMFRSHVRPQPEQPSE